jgi:hypothetical protein
MHWLLPVELGILVSVVILTGTFLIVWRIAFGTYHPATATESDQLGSESVYHFIPTRHLQINGDQVTVTPRPFRWPHTLSSEDAVSFFYSGHRPRGGRINHGFRTKNGPYSLITIQGPDFAASPAAGRLFWRTYDGAFAVTHSYVGHGTVEHGVDPVARRSARSSTTSLVR